MSVKKIALNTFVSAGARVIGLALSLIFIGLLTRYLGQSGFGQYSTILAFLYIFIVISDLGLYSICVRDISRPQADEVKIASTAFSIRMIAGFFVFLTAPLIALFFPYVFEVKVGILIGSFGFWLMSSQQVLMGIFQKNLRMDKVAIAELAGRLAQLFFIIFVINQDLGFLWVVVAFISGALVNFLLVFSFAKKYIKLKINFDLVYWKGFLKESLPLGVASILTMLYFKLDTVMLSVLKDQADVGIYGLAYRILESLLFFPAMFVGLVMPLMSKYVLTDKKKFKKITQKTLDLVLVSAIILITTTWLLSEKIILLISGPDFILSAEVLNILIIATGIIFIAVLLSNMIIVLKKQKSLMYIYGVAALFNVVANLILIPKYSYYGAALTTVITEFIVVALMVWILFKTLHYLPSFWVVFKCLIAALVSGAVVCLLSGWSLLILIILSVLIYLGLIYLLRVFSKEDILMIFKSKENV